MSITGRDFTWDDVKAQSNLAKHGVPFPYAARVFLDPQRVEFDASREGDGEVRRKAVGRIEGKLYVLVYTDREGVYRIISARRTNATEERAYGQVQS
jgi:uncharacterized DUF497 family protein